MEPGRSELHAALAGNKQALQILTDALSPVIHARVAKVLVRHRPGDSNLRQEIDDLIQEVFLSLFDRDAKILQAWEPERGLSLRNFVGLVAERHVISWLRRARGNPWTEEPTEDNAMEAHLVAASHDTGPDSGAPGAERRLLSRQVLTALMERLQEDLSPLGMHLFRRLFIQEVSVPEVCSEMNMHRDAVYAWRSRLSRRVRDLGQEILSDPPAGTRKPPYESSSGANT